jgi:hypothetical protein
MGQERRWWVVEGALTGLATGSALVAAGALAVGSLRPSELPTPYWVRLGWLRTDTLGVVCFVIATLAFTASESLRLSRTATRPTSAPADASSGPTHVLTLAAARALTAAAAVLVVYLSVNAVTHPRSLDLPATHFGSWPTESTLRVAACVVVTIAAGIARTKRIAVTGWLHD